MWHLCAEYAVVRDGMSVNISCYNINFPSQSILPRLVPQQCMPSLTRAKRLIREEEGSNKIVPKLCCCQGKIQSSSSNFNRE